MSSSRHLALIVGVTAAATVGCFGGGVDTGQADMTVRACTEICAEEAWRFGCDGVMAYSDVEATCEVELSNNYSPSQIAAASVNDCEDYGVQVGAQDCADAGGGGDSGGEGDGPSQAECYDAGWGDCEQGYAPDPDYWSCSSTVQYEGYEAGYCDCEVAYNMLYYCL